MATPIGGLSSFMGVGPSSFGSGGVTRPANLGTGGGLPNLNPSNPALKAYSGRGWEGGVSGSGLRMPLGRPVVPDE